MSLAHCAGQLQVGLVENLHWGSTGDHTLNDRDAIEHRSRRPSPFRQYQHVAGAECRLPFSSCGPPIVLLPDAFS